MVGLEMVKGEALEPVMLLILWERATCRERAAIWSSMALMLGGGCGWEAGRAAIIPARSRFKAAPREEILDVMSESVATEAEADVRHPVDV